MTAGGHAKTKIPYEPARRKIKHGDRSYSGFRAATKGSGVFEVLTKVAAKGRRAAYRRKSNLVRHNSW